MKNVILEALTPTQVRRFEAAKLFSTFFASNTLCNFQNIGPSIFHSRFALFRKKLQRLASNFSAESRQERSSSKTICTIIIIELLFSLSSLSLSIIYHHLIFILIFTNHAIIAILIITAMNFSYYHRNNNSVDCSYVC